MLFVCLWVTYAKNYSTNLTEILPKISEEIVINCCFDCFAFPRWPTFAVTNILKSCIFSTFRYLLPLFFWDFLVMNLLFPNLWFIVPLSLVFSKRNCKCIILAWELFLDGWWPPQITHPNNGSPNHTFRRTYFKICYYKLLVVNLELQCSQLWIYAIS